VLPPLNQPGMTIPYGDSTRHRVLQVTGRDIRGDTYQIAGWYEPIRGYDRSQGAASISKNGAVQKFIQPIWDDTIGTHLARAVRCFTGEDENPCSVVQALRIVRFMEQCTRPTLGAPISLTFTISSPLTPEQGQWAPHEYAQSHRAWLSSVPINPAPAFPGAV
jgi:hypothetical protein